MALHGERAQHRKGHLHQQRQASVRPKAALSLSIWKSQVGRPLKVRHSNNNLFFFARRLIALNTNTGPEAAACLPVVVASINNAQIRPTTRERAWCRKKGRRSSPASAFWRAISRHRTSAVVVTASPTTTLHACVLRATPKACTLAPPRPLPCHAMRVRNVAVAGSHNIDFDTIRGPHAAVIFQEGQTRKTGGLALSLGASIIAAAPCAQESNNDLPGEETGALPVWDGDGARGAANTAISRMARES